MSIPTTRRMYASLSLSTTGAARDTTPTDSRSQRNRASRRGGQLTTRARSSSYRSACPHLRAPGASVPDGRTIRCSQAKLQRDVGPALLIPVNNPLERIMKEIRRRTRVVGAFPDGQSCLNLAALHQAAAGIGDDELHRGIYSLKEASIVIEQWPKHYNTIRPHSSLNYRPPAPQRHHRPKCFIWIAAHQCSSLYPAGPKYPSGQGFHSSRRAMFRAGAYVRAACPVGAIIARLGKFTGRHGPLQMVATRRFGRGGRGGTLGSTGPRIDFFGPSQSEPKRKRRR
jgi:hypothetical protein